MQWASATVPRPPVAVAAVAGILASVKTPDRGKSCGQNARMSTADDIDIRPERTRILGRRPDSFRPLGAQCTLVTIGQPLEPAELEQVAALIQGRPDVTLRFHTKAARDLEFLRYFPRLQRLSVDLWELEDIAGFAHLQGGLELLHFGKTEKRFSLRFLQTMPALRTLSLVGHTRDIASLTGLDSLTSLALRGITLPDLSIVASLRELETFTLLLGGTTHLDHLAVLPKLQNLSLMQVTRLADLSILARLRFLKTLDLDSLRNVTTLPSLAALPRLENVTLETLKGLTDLAPIAAAPALRRLTIAGMPQLPAEAFRCLVGHPSLTELHLWSSLGGVSLKKPVLEAVKELLPAVVRP
jgi:hypothetical protein